MSYTFENIVSASKTTTAINYSNTRLQSMDLLKFIAIFLVLWGHAEQYLLSCDASERAVYRHIYSFHMPLFMMVSGFFFAMTLKTSVKRNIIVKARQLLLPAFCWAVIFKIISSTFHHSFLSWREMTDIVLNSFWFLKSAFACSILGLFPLLIFRRHMIWVGIITLILSQFLIVIPVLNLQIMYPSFFVGGMIYLYHNYFTKYGRYIILICGIIWILCNMNLISEDFSSETIEELISHNSIFQIIHHKLFMIVMGLCGALTFFMLFDIIFKTPRDGRLYQLFASCGKMTLGIYILQVFLLETFLASFANFDNISNGVFDFIISPLISIGVLVACVGMIQIIKSNRYVSFFLLGTKWPNRT